MPQTAAVQMLININGKSVALKNNKKNIVSLKVSRTIGDAANKFTLELFDETAWRLESALYKTKLTPISIQYGATADWANGKHITFTGMCTNYNLSFVGAATMLSIEGVVYGVTGASGTESVNFWFKNETVNWVDTNIAEPTDDNIRKLGSDSAYYRAACMIDGKKLHGTDGITGGLDQGFEDIINGEYADYICARIEWIPPEYSESGHWECRPLINPTNVFKRIIRKYNGEIGNKYDNYQNGNFKIHPTEVDESLWVDASNLDMTQTNTTAADFITNVLCKIAVKPGARTAGFKYYIKNGAHCFKAVDYSSEGADKIVKTGYFTKDSDVISFSLNQSGAMVMAGADTDEDTGEPLVDVSTIDSLTGQIITSQGYFAEGHYKAESTMDDSTKVNSTNWYFRKVSSVGVVSSSSQNILDVNWGDAFTKLKEFALSATLTIWGEYNNKYVPGNYLDITVMTPDNKQHYSSGKYYIISADDSVTVDGYTTTLKLFKIINESINTFSDTFNAEKLKAGTYAYGGINPYDTSNESSTPQSGTSSYNPSPAISEGQTIQLPALLGSIFTYMGWQCITSTTSTQYKLREQAGMNFDNEGFGIIDGRYVVACTTTYGTVGDYISVTQQNGNVLKCIIGDIKNQSDAGANKWGHQGGKCVIEFVVDKRTWYSTKSGGNANSMHANPGTTTCHREWGGTYISSIKNEGNYFNKK